MFNGKFKDKMDVNEIIKKGKNNDKYYIDTTAINRIILNRAGLKLENIIDSQICTKCNSNKIHSYRDEGNFAGRNTGIMTLI